MYNVSIKNRWHPNPDSCRRAYFIKGQFKTEIAKERGVIPHQREPLALGDEGTVTGLEGESPQKKAIWRGGETLPRVIANPRQSRRERSREINTMTSLNSHTS